MCIRSSWFVPIFFSGTRRHFIDCLKILGYIESLAIVTTRGDNHGSDKLNYEQGREI
jgi:hypothetical protein